VYGLHGALTSDDQAGGWKVGARNESNEVAQFVRSRRTRSRLGEVRAFNQPDAAVDHLAQVVRRHVGRHADSDTGRSVDEQVGKRCGENGRLFGRLVVVRREVDGLLVQVRHRFVGERLEPRLGVTHRRGRVAVHRTEVALAVDQRVAHVEVLRQPHQRVVDRLVAVGMEIAHHLADDLRALAVATRRPQTHGLHAVQDAAMRRLQPIARVGQRSSNDYAHGVIHVRPLHFVFDVDGGCRLRDEVGHRD
jgi:hypothetical protein